MVDSKGGSVTLFVPAPPFVPSVAPGRPSLNCRTLISLHVFWSILTLCSAGTAEVPRIANNDRGGQLILDGKPYLILGGELGNSTAGTAEQADEILPRIAEMHVNTLLMPVAWEQIEPVEGKFYFSILDHWIDTARQQHLHLVLLWFGSWKNSVSSYVPEWVKRDTRRFPRAITADGLDLEILSTLSTENQRADARAFSALMKHVKAKDAEQQTVLMVQVENEVGYLGGGRDRSAAANHAFEGAVPSNLIDDLRKRRESLSPELAAHLQPQGKTWHEVFGDAADEVFMTWNYARYIESVTVAGKREYPLPMYVNCQLPAESERAGEYPSGGPHPYYLDVYRVTARTLDFFSPDIYWPNFEYWAKRYELPGNPLFIPEARLESAVFNALYAYGEAGAFGFSPFAIESQRPPAGAASQRPTLVQAYEVLDQLKDFIPAAQVKGATRGLVLHASSPRSTQTVAIGGYLMTASLSRSYPARTLLTDDGGMLVLESSPNEFYIVGSGLSVTFSRDPDTDNRLAGIATIEEVSRVHEKWITLRRLNGDQSNQGRQLQMATNQIQIYRVVLYTAERTPTH
jgi:hypothetical protein